MYNQKRSETSCLPVPASEEHFSQVLIDCFGPLQKNQDQKCLFNSIQFKALFGVDINHTYNTSSNEFLKSTMVYKNTYNLCNSIQTQDTEADIN
jgi:hypothetical protein